MEDLVIYIEGLFPEVRVAIFDLEYEKGDESYTVINNAVDQGKSYILATASKSIQTHKLRLVVRHAATSVHFQELNWSSFGLVFAAKLDIDRVYNGKKTIPSDWNSDTEHSKAQIISQHVVTRLSGDHNLNIQQLEDYIKSLHDKYPNLSDYSTPKPDGDLPDIESILTEKQTSYSYRNDQIEPTLNVDFFANQFYNLIRNIQDRESGLLLGIFGKWGRGKTFLWNQLLSKIKSDDLLEEVEFHPWRFQDTPAIWAYLYETLAKTYLRSSTSFGRYYKLLKLNLLRKGYSALLWYLLYLGLTIVWYFSIDLGQKIGLIFQVISYIGIPTFTALLLFYYHHSVKAKKIIANYLRPVDFKGLLGLQYEIQEELKFLLRCWKKSGERVVLFVDDLDRCHEDKIIKVIDSLKVMLDEEQIYQRLIVVAAVDELVLSRVITDKYFRLIDQDLRANNEEKSNTLHLLTREYLDKLFISGIKLPKLNTKDKLIFLNKLTDGKVQVRNPDSWTPDSLGTQIQPMDQAKNESSDEIHVIPDDNFEIMDHEYLRLKRSLENDSELTPRRIRIFYYRYLSAKGLFDLYLPNNSDIRSIWNENEENKKILTDLLIEYGVNKDISQLKRKRSGDKQTIVVRVLGNRYEIEKELYNRLVQICECVIPY